MNALVALGSDHRSVNANYSRRIRAAVRANARRRIFAVVAGRNVYVANLNNPAAVWNLYA